MKNTSHPLYYGDYLQLDRLLDAQAPESVKQGVEAHDEMLFIITHQTYELWFKQILYELGSIAALFNKNYVDETSLGIAVARLDRVRAIQRLLNEQIAILETMTPLDFLDFRNLLTPASGFQSVQFRCIEHILGLETTNAAGAPTHSKREAHLLQTIQAQPSLFTLVQSWLERIPFLEYREFAFEPQYRRAVERMLTHDRNIIQRNPHLDDHKRKLELLGLEDTRQSFECLLDAKRYVELQQTGRFRFSRQALLAALFINLYRDEPILHLPFRFLTGLLELDELLTTWRYHHAMLAHRMLGTKIGTGGSSGHTYLKRSIEEKRIFIDLFNLPTFLIPRSALPTLPQSLQQSLGFFFAGSARRQSK